MSAIPFTDLKIILSQLSKQEISSARKFLVAFDAEGHRSSNKNFILFDFLVQNPAATYNRALLSGGSFDGKKSFDQQCRRLKEKIAESMILDVNIKRPDTEQTYLQARLYIRKKLLIATMLLERGAEHEALSLCERLIKQAQEYELYSELYEILFTIRHETGLRNGVEILDEINGDIEFYRTCEQAVYRARELYGTANSYNGPANVLHLNFLSNAKAEVALSVLRTHSATLSYYYYLLEIGYYFAKKEYQLCVNFGQKLVQLIQGHPALKSEMRLGAAYVELARSYDHLQNYTESVHFAEKAEQLLPLNSYYFDMALEIRFTSLFHQGKLEEAAIILQKLIEITDKKKQPHIYWKRQYYLSCLNFSLKKYTDSIRVMERIGKPKEEPETWNLGRKIITILCEIEMGKFDKSDRSIEALRKYLQRNATDEQQLLHYKNIVKILVNLSNRSYLFQELRSVLLLTPPETNAIALSTEAPEIQLFSKWLDSRMNSKVA